MIIGEDDEQPPPTPPREPSDEDKRQAALVVSLIGRTVVDAVWDDANPVENWEDKYWAEHEYVLLTFDDGRVIRFSGWGYDAWGVTVDLEPPT